MIEEYMGNQCLVIGGGSGLGKHLREKLCCSFVDRTSITDLKLLTKSHFKLIIFCYNPSAALTCPSQDYENESILWASRISTDYFFLISSIDVVSDYGCNDADLSRYFYIRQKTYFEEYAKKNINNSYIIRCGALLGLGMKENNVWRILFEKNPALSLSQDSTFSFCLYDDIFIVLNRVTTTATPRIINAISSDIIEVCEIVNHFGKACAVNYGSYKYLTSRKIFHSGFILDEINLPAIDKLEVFKRYCDERKKF